MGPVGFDGTLAGFIADASQPQTWDETVAVALSTLAGDFGIAPEPVAGGDSRAGQPNARRTTWLDTFDWRLHKAGLTLEHVSSRDGTELRLSGAGGSDGSGGSGGDATQRVTDWPTARSRQLPGLADGPVVSRLGSVVPPRALVPVVATSTVTTGYRLLNEDGKTVARLRVDRPSVAGARAGGIAQPRVAQSQSQPDQSRTAQPRPVPLPPRLTVTAVRGYPGPARRAVRLLEAVPGLHPAAEPPFADALRALGRHPGDYSNKVNADITARMPAPRAVATVLLRLLDTIDANVPGVLADTDTEFLHDLRVSVRRTRSAVKLFGDVLAGLGAAELASFAAEFRWVGELTTPTRDLDVHLLDFAATAVQLAAARPEELEPFRVYLEQRRRREFRALTRGLRSARFVNLTQEWRIRLTKIQQEGGAGGNRPGRFHPGPGAAPGAGESAGLLAAERTRVAFAKVARRGAAITAQTPAEPLHDLRKRAKELRYALEFFAPLYDTAASGKVLGDLKRLQDCLGEFQDTEVQIGEIRTLAAAMLTAGEAPALTLLAMGEITAGLAARQQAARADFEHRFAAFADMNGQRRMSALIRGVPENPFL